MSEGDTLVNALVGGIASVVLSVVPLSPVLGGALAGYLQGGSRDDGLHAGLYSGLVAAVPLAAGGVLFLLWGTFLLGFGSASELGVVVIFAVALVGLVGSALYTVGLGAVGGWLGNYVRYDVDSPS
jgi:hypothetical protein